MKVFLATPFFNPAQEERMERVYKVLVDEGYEVWCAGKMMRLSHKPNQEERNNCFDTDLKHMRECDVLVAITNDYDPGTLFEVGYVFSLNKRVIGVAFDLDGPFNLMLAQSFNVVTSDMEELKEALRNPDYKKDFEGKVE